MSGKDRRFRVSDTIGINEFGQSWHQILSTTSIVETNGTQTSTSDATDPPMFGLNFPEIPDELQEELKDVCSIATLKCDQEPDRFEFASKDLATQYKILHNVPDDVDLATIKLEEQELQKRWKSHNYMRKVTRNRRKRHDYETHMMHFCKNLELEGTEGSVDPSDVIISVIVCSLSTANTTWRLRKGGVKFIVLGSQKLTELRDRFTCIADIAVPGEFGNNPDNPQDIRAEELYKSGFFFFNGTFYNDLRDPSCRDYSKIIIDWANSNPSRKLGPFRTARMEDTTFAELNIQLGYPYLYMHQGNCEHIVLFTDLRLVSPDDCSVVMQYPMFVSIRRKKRHLCMLCQMSTPKWFTVYSSDVPHDTCFFCDVCFRYFNYNRDNEAIRNICAYLYFDDVATL